MKLYLNLFLFLIIYLSPAFPQTHQASNKTASFQEARNAYFQMDHEAAYSTFSRVMIDDSQSLKDRASAGRVKAKMEWMFYSDSQKALETIKALEELDFEKSALYLLKARILAEELKYDDALEGARKANRVGDSETEFYHTSFSIANILLKKYENEVFKNGVQSFSKNQEFNEAYQNLTSLAKSRPGDVDMANLQLGYAILSKNGKALFEAWMSYYRLTDISQVHPSLIHSIKAFEDAAINYQAKKTKDEDIDIIILGLAESGFYEYASLLKAFHYGTQNHDNQKINEIIEYKRFLTKVENITNEFYLKTLNGEKNKEAEKSRRGEYVNKLLGEARNLWNLLEWEGEKPEFSKEVVMKEFRARFKVIIAIFPANGYFGLQMGHIILDDTRIISQYDQKAEFRYVSIDHMISNGYSGWFWDGLAQTGGWADNGESFLQVRSAYTAGPVHEWMKISDPKEIEKTKEKMAKFLVQDDSIARANPYSYLPGLDTRINYYETKAIHDSLVNKGLEGAQLRLAFINMIEAIDQEASIYAHEGRHSIDKKNGYSEKSEELEYTAKLSEVYFSKKPKYSFTAILSRNIGDQTSHGQANLRVIKGVVKWMKKHQDQIEDFDSSRPVLPQLDKLTDQQLRMAVKSLDPMGQ